MTFPRDGHLPSHDATGCDEFPAKPAVTEWGGVDEMGPWLRVKARTGCSSATVLSTGRRIVLSSRAGHFVSRNVTVPISCINAFIMTWTTPSVYMGRAVAMITWTLRQVSYGP